MIIKLEENTHDKKQMIIFSFKNFVLLQLIYNVVLISAVQQRALVIYTYILFHTLFKNVYLFIRLHWVLVVALRTFDLHCIMQNLQLRRENSQLWHVGSVQFPEQGSNLGLLHQEHGVLATGPPGKSHLFHILFYYVFKKFLGYS